MSEPALYESKLRHEGNVASVGLRSAASVLFLVTVGGCALGGDIGDDERESASASSSFELAKFDANKSCESLRDLTAMQLGDSTARVVSASFQEASEARTIPGAPPWANSIPAMPRHCEVQGVMRERIGAHDQSYAVKFRIRMPTNWNERFFFEGGGGTNGILGQATGSSLTDVENALDRGFAVVATDTGHDNSTNFDPNRQGNVAFGHDYIARLEYAEKALNSVAIAAKATVASFYGAQPKFSYFVGCSNGGREGMVFAQRYPEHFDGIVASAPAFAVPKAAIAEAWDTQVFGQVAASAGALTSAGLPDIARVFSRSDFKIVNAAVESVCDADDGLQDGMVQRFSMCTTDRVRPVLEKSMCVGGKTESCLTPNQISALIASISGPTNSKGEELYADWPWDLGIGDMGWVMWKFGMPGAMQAINVELGSPALSGLFMTPPKTVAGDSASSQLFQMEFDFDEDAPKIFGTSPEFPRSGWDLVGAQSTDLKSFKARGGKMVIPHGNADPIFSINDTVKWWQQVDDVERGNAADFVRVFAVPGMNHCGQGPATDQYDALGALMDWVEEGRAPERIIATAGPRAPWPGRTRPLCAFPNYARYRDGDAEKAENFVCEVP